MPMRILRLAAALAAAAAIAVLVPSAAQAQKVPKIVERTFVLEEASVNREIEWHYLDSETRDRCATWTDATGLERTVYSLEKPVRHKLIAIGRQVSLVPETLMRMEGQVTRKADWDEHLPECGTCGGELGDCVGRADPPLEPIVRPDCGTRRLTAPQLHFVMVPKGAANRDDDDLLSPLGRDVAHVNADVVSNAPTFKTCPPTQPGGPGLPHRTGVGVRFTKEYRQLMTVRRGGTVRFKGRSRIGHVIPFQDWSGGRFTEVGTCPSLSGAGRQVCDTVHVEATFRRIA